MSRILVVDDNLDFAQTVADGLADAGYETVALGSSRAALEALKEGGIDALVTDLRMPDLDGLQLADAARALVPTRPVILMTAHGAAGSYPCLTKPFKSEQLRRLLEQVLTTRRS